MARAVAKYVFAALLALLSTQAAAPSLRVVGAAEIVWCAQAEQQAPREDRGIRMALPATQPALLYVSRTRPEPDAAVLFQRPPPTPFLFS
jgi:hypothetical protein